MADIQVEVDQAARRAGDYWEIDGLPSLALACGYLLMGPIFFWWWNTHAIRRHVWLWAASLLIIIAYVFLVGLRTSPVMRWLKARITYPRTGYVAAPPSKSAEAAKLKQQDWDRHPDNWMLATWGLPGLFDEPWVGAVLLMVATSILWGTTRGKFPSAAILLPGFYLTAIVMAFVPVAPEERMGCWTVAWGLVYLLAGTIQLVRFLRRHPVVHA